MNDDPVLAAFKDARAAGTGMREAFETAVEAYKKAHPDASDREARAAVSRLIAEAPGTESQGLL